MEDCTIIALWQGVEDKDKEYAETQGGLFFPITLRDDLLGDTNGGWMYCTHADGNLQPVLDGIEDGSIVLVAGVSKYKEEM